MTTTGDMIVPVAIFEHKEDNRPVRHDLPWQSLAQRLCQYEERLLKDGRAWSPVTYRAGSLRGKAGVDQVHALVLDIDHDTLPLDLLEGLEYVAHTTFSHTADDPRWRCVLPLASPIPGPDWPDFWLRANAHFGGCVDPQTKDSSRIFYLPSCPPSTLHEAKHQHGAFLDPSSLPEVPRFVQQSAPATRLNGSITAVQADSLAAWAGDFCTVKLQDLTRMPPRSGRNAACNRLAFLLAGLAADDRHHIETAWVAQELYSACEHNALVSEDGERSVRATIASGMTAGMTRPWSPADRDDVWRPAPTLTVPTHIDPVTGEVVEDSPWRTAGELVRLAPETGRQIVEGLLWEGRTHWVYSGPGAGKTLTWLAILLHVAAGKPFHGRPVVQGPVIIIEEDSPDAVIADYLLMLAEIYDIDLDAIPLWFNRIRGIRLKDQVGLDAVRAMIAKAPQKPIVCMLDACERIVPSESFNSNELDPLSRLFTMNQVDGITNLMIDHTRKPGSSTEKPDLIDLLYGGRTKSAISDVMMFFSGAIKSQATIQFPKFRGDEPAPITLSFDGSAGFTIKTGKPRISESERQVMMVLNNTRGRLTREDIEALTKLTTRTAQRALTRLVDIGWVEREGDSRAATYKAGLASGGIFS